MRHALRTPPRGKSRDHPCARGARRHEPDPVEPRPRVGLTWNGRQYTPGDFTSGDPANQAITAAAQCMYGIAQTTVTALGCATGLGFIHSGHELAFVLDIADLYKTEIAIPIPIAFDVAAQSPEDVGSRTRRAIRDRVNDIKQLLVPVNIEDPADSDTDRVTLQTDHGAEVESGRNYGWPDW